MKTVYVYGETKAVVLFPDEDGAIVRELDDLSETWLPWSVLKQEPIHIPTDRNE